MMMAAITLTVFIALTEFSATGALSIQTTDSTGRKAPFSEISTPEPLPGYYTPEDDEIALQFDIIQDIAYHDRTGMLRRWHAI